MNIFEVIAVFFDPITGKEDVYSKTKIMAKNSVEAAQIQFNYLSQHQKENIRIVDVCRVKRTDAPRPWETRDAFL